MMSPLPHEPRGLEGIRRIVAEAVPGARNAPLRPLGGGLDHHAYLLGDVVVRFGTGDANREAQLLRVVAEVCAVPVPAPLRATASWMAYRRLDGVPKALPDRVRAHVDDILRAPVPAAGTRRVFSHNDLGIEHVLVDPWSGAVTGIIDWSDAAIVDPAKDLGLVLRDLGPEALDVALDRASSRLDPDGGLRERAAFYARCLALEDLAFGLQTGQAKYADTARHALIRLFAGQR